jgi:hypothetical protein
MTFIPSWGLQFCLYNRNQCMTCVVTGCGSVYTSNESLTLVFVLAACTLLAFISTLWPRDSCLSNSHLSSCAPNGQGEMIHASLQ